MLKKSLTLLTLLALAAYAPKQGPLSAQAYAMEMVAVLGMCNGEVVVHRGGKNLVATFGFQLGDGDQVVTGAGASATIM